MRGQNYLIMTKANQKRANFFNDGDVIEIAFLFGHELLAEHCNIVNYIVLNHIEHVFLESQAITISDQLQRF